MIEAVGLYNPRKEGENLTLDRARLEYWVGKGARPSATVARLIKRTPAPAPVKA